MEAPNGYDNYLVKLKGGGIYMVDNPMIKNQVKYYDSVYYSCGSIRVEEIEDWIGFDDTVFFEKSNFEKGTLILLIAFYKHASQFSLDKIDEKFVNDFLTNYILDKNEK